MCLLTIDYFTHNPDFRGFALVTLIRISSTPDSSVLLTSRYQPIASLLFGFSLVADSAKASSDRNFSIFPRKFQCGYECNRRQNKNCQYDCYRLEPFFLRIFAALNQKIPGSHCAISNPTVKETIFATNAYST